MAQKGHLGLNLACVVHACNYKVHPCQDGSAHENEITAPLVLVR